MCVGTAGLAAASERDVGRPELVEQVTGHQSAGLTVDEAGAVDRDRPDVDRRVAQQDGDRGEVAQVEVGIDDDRDAVRRGLAGHGPGRGSPADEQRGEDHGETRDRAATRACRPIPGHATPS